MSEVKQTEILDLEAGSEWRFELEGDENMAVRILSPDPTYVNSEEVPGSTWYPFYRNLKSSLYCPHPTQIEALERIRILARRHASSSNGNGTPQPDGLESQIQGPRVMILGPPCSGKTTIVKNLVNMALSSGSGWTPGIIGLDPSSPANLIPGSLSLSTPFHPIPTHGLAQPLGSPPTSVPANTLGADVSCLSWWYGQMEPSNRGVDLWRKLVMSIGLQWRDRCEKDPIALASGLLIDTPSAFTNQLLGTRKDNPRARYSLVAEAVEHFGIDTVIVVGHEKLTIDLTRLLPSVRVLRIGRSSGTVDLDDSYRQIVASAQVRGYFYGEPSPPKEIEGLHGRMVALEGSLSPYSFQIGWETLTILRVGEENAAPTSALPLGSSRILSPTRLSRVDPSGPAHITRLLNAVLAIVAITPDDRIKRAGEAADQSVKEEMKVEGDAEQNNDAKDDPDQLKEEDTEMENEGEDIGDDDEVPFREDTGYREVLGFIVITGIDTQRKKYTVLSPSPGKLPSTVAIAGSIEWVDSE